MVNRRGHTITETLAGTSLLLVLMAAHAPARGPGLVLVESVEAEVARLLVEGELTLVRQEVARGALGAGAWRRDARRWPSAARLRDVELVATVSAADGDGLVEVAVEARWRAGASLEDGPRSARLGALVRAGRTP